MQKRADNPCNNVSMPERQENVMAMGGIKVEAFERSRNNMKKVYFQDVEVQVIDELDDNIIVRLDGQNVCVARKDLRVETVKAEEPKPKKKKADKVG